MHSIYGTRINHILVHNDTQLACILRRHGEGRHIVLGCTQCRVQQLRHRQTQLFKLQMRTNGRRTRLCGLIVTTITGMGVSDLAVLGLKTSVLSKR